MIDGTVRADGLVGTWGWAKVAPTEELRSWLTNGFDDNRTQDQAVLAMICERLEITAREIVDIIYPD